MPRYQTPGINVFPDKPCPSESPAVWEVVRKCCGWRHWYCDDCYLRWRDVINKDVWGIAPSFKCLKCNAVHHHVDAFIRGMRR